MTASIGVAIVAPRIGRSPDGAVQVADEALYSAKRSGRNCISVVDCDQVHVLDRDIPTPGVIVRLTPAHP